MPVRSLDAIAGQDQGLVVWERLVGIGMLAQRSLSMKNILKNLIILFSSVYFGGPVN
jgi:hypothetical protein